MIVEYQIVGRNFIGVVSYTWRGLHWGIYDRWRDLHCGV